MIPFQQMVQKVISSVYYDKMQRFVKPLEDHFGVNHFWYNRVTYSGHYSFVGSHSAWNEFLFSQDFISSAPYFRHPDRVTCGIILMKNTPVVQLSDLFDTAAKRFGINFNIFLLKKTSEGLEGYGFGTHLRMHLRDEYLLNELPVLTHFVKQFRQENQNLFKIVHDNQVDLASHLGQIFYESPQAQNFPTKREEFLRKMGFEDFLDLSPQEKLVFEALANGFPARYIAKKLFLSPRTIEHYFESIKQKLSVGSKVELIEKAQEFVAMNQQHIKF